MLKDAPNFKETIAKAATGTRGDENIRNADYSQKGIKQYNKHQEKYRKYQDKLNNQTLEAAIYKLDIDDKAALNKYLVAILEGDIDNPSLDQYFQEHKSDILYLCCLDESLKNKVLKHHKLA